MLITNRPVLLRERMSGRAVRRLCLERRPTSELVLRRARISGPLQLDGQTVERSVKFVECEFLGPIDLTGAIAAQGLSFEHCRLRDVYAERFRSNGDLVLEHSHCDGLLSLCGARIAGHLRCTGSTFTSSTGKCFNAKGITVEGAALFDGRFTATGEFALTSARIGGTIDMTAATFSGADPVLVADGVRVGADLLLCGSFTAKGTVVLTEARVVGKITCSGGGFTASGRPNAAAIDARSVEASEMRLDQRFTAVGAVHLEEARLHDGLTCVRGSFVGDGHYALKADGLDCPRVELGHGFHATGEVSLVGAHIAHELNCTSGTFRNPKGCALQLDGLICGGKIYLNETFSSDGEVSLHCARVGTELNCSNGTFRNPGRIALGAGGLACEGRVFLNETFGATGELQLTDATIGGELNCKDGWFDAFSAPRLRVGGKFEWLPRNTPGAVDVSFAEVALLLDRKASWPANGRTRLNGLTLRSLGSPGGQDDGGMSARERIGWLWNTKDFAPGVYRQFVSIFRQLGQAKLAQEIAIACERDRRRRGGMSRPAKVWSWLLDRLVGYGYKVHWPVIAVFCLGTLAAIAFYYAQFANIMEPVSAHPGGTNANVCTSDYPCFMPVVYSYELFLPVINLHQIGFWLPSGATLWGKVLLAYVWLAIGGGWFATAFMAAGIGHLINTRD